MINKKQLTFLILILITLILFLFMTVTPMNFINQQDNFSEIHSNVNSNTTSYIKTATITKVNPIKESVNNTVILQANVTDQKGNNVTGGKVVFKINGKTLKDSNNKALVVNVTNGIAKTNYILPNKWVNKNLTIEAVYSGTLTVYNNSTGKINVNITKK